MAERKLGARLKEWVQWKYCELQYLYSMRRIRARLKKLFKEAADNVENDINDYMKKFDKRGTKENIFYKDALKRTEEQKADPKRNPFLSTAYQTFLRITVFRGADWLKRVTNTKQAMRKATDEAMRIIWDEQHTLFAENANFLTYRLEVHYGTHFPINLYDKATVKRLIKEHPELLPRKYVNGKKLNAWNQRNIANAVSLSIMNGESIPMLAKRIAEKTGTQNMDSCIRYARTAMTAAQNAGRIESMRRAKELGLNVRKRWLATLDSRTRDSHADLDGQTAEIDEPFHSAHGDIMYPGDPSADPAEIWNCRCSLVSEYPDLKDLMQHYRRDNDTGEIIDGDITYNEWKKMKQK